MTKLLETADLVTNVYTYEGVVKALDHVSLSLDHGMTFGLVGESGCGKSVTALSIMRLLPKPAGIIESGRILFRDEDIVSLDADRMHEIRGKRISMIFQEPMTSLNPVFPVGDQVGEVIRLHEGLSRAATRERVIEMFQLVGIPAAQKRLNDYPHQMSGGMRQRAMIAMALALEPKLLIADEPTTALDVTIQAEILSLLAQLQERLGMAMIFVSHDLGIVSRIADRVLVMYAGQVVEEAPVAAIFAMPQHPYTVGLMGAMPALAAAGARLAAIDGMVPAATAMPEGCRFAARCPFADPQCRVMPPLQDLGGGRRSRCWKVPLESLAASLPALRVAA